MTVIDQISYMKWVKFENKKSFINIFNYYIIIGKRWRKFIAKKENYNIPRNAYSHLLLTKIIVTSKIIIEKV